MEASYGHLSYQAQTNFKLYKTQYYASPQDVQETHPHNTYTTLEPYASQLRQKAQHSEHALHQFTLQSRQSRDKKQTIFHNVNCTANRDTSADTTCDHQRYCEKQHEAYSHRNSLEAPTDKHNNRVLNCMSLKYAPNNRHNLGTNVEYLHN